METPRDTSGAIRTTQVKLHTLVNETIAFVRNQLPVWRDHPHRVPEEAEDKLNLQLCKFLDVRARHEYPMAHFHHEEPQTGRRRVDLSVSPHELIIAETRQFSIFDPYLVIEGKRLPAPSKDREKEYVTGFAEKSGGIQRFKLGLHGAELDIAVMVGYVQAGNLGTWLVTINGWISSLTGMSCSEGCHWLADERLTDVHEDAVRRVATSISRHPRVIGDTASHILIHHLWISL